MAKLVIPIIVRAAFRKGLRSQVRDWWNTRKGGSVVQVHPSQSQQHPRLNSQAGQGNLLITRRFVGSSPTWGTTPA